MAVGALGAIATVVVAEGRALARDRPPPNVVVVMTDDQEATSLAHMRVVRRKLAMRGTTFANAFATFPVCCPSRATLLTGQYAHNHGVLGNLPPNGGHQAFDERWTLPVALRRGGYRTGFVGRYLNGYGNDDPRAVPRGWHHWVASVEREFHMYRYSLNENGRIRTYGKRSRDYQTDVMARKAATFLRRGARGRKPLFLTLSMLAPHERPHKQGPPNPVPAPRHQGRFADVRPPPAPAFNEADVSDKPGFVSRRLPLDSREMAEMVTRYRDRLASLLAVDEAVARLVGVLRRARELGNTVIVFTSDNGFLLGQHRLYAKSWLYEESARVPLVLRGPGVPRGVVRRQLVGNIDLAPTILQFAGVEPLRVMDGRPLRPLARKPKLAAGRHLLLENQRSAAVRTPRYMYAEHPTGETELYDLRADPFQLESRHDDPGLAGVRAGLADRLAELRDCAGSACR